MPHPSSRSRHVVDDQGVDARKGNEIPHLPYGWNEFVDEKTQRVYYFDGKKTTWNNPHLGVDWLIQIDARTKKKYYYNKLTKKSQWTWPLHKAEHPMVDSEDSGGSSGGEGGKVTSPDTNQHHHDKNGVEVNEKDLDYLWSDEEWEEVLSIMIRYEDKLEDMKIELDRRPERDQVILSRVWAALGNFFKDGEDGSKNWWEEWRKIAEEKRMKIHKELNTHTRIEMVKDAQRQLKVLWEENIESLVKDDLAAALGMKPEETTVWDIITKMHPKEYPEYDDTGIDLEVVTEDALEQFADLCIVLFVDIGEKMKNELVTTEGDDEYHESEDGRPKMEPLANQPHPTTSTRV